MFHLSRLWPSRALVASIIAVVAALGAAAALAITGQGGVPGSDGVIHSCFNSSSNPSGQLRVINSEAGVKCSKNELALDFNQTGIQGPQGEQGVQGDQGIQGIQGIQGVPGLSGLQVVAPPPVSIPANSSGFAQANCPAGKSPISGGYLQGGVAGPITSSFITATGWQVAMFNSEDSARPLSVSVLCAIVG